MVFRAKAGPMPIPYKELTAEKLANAILEALKPETLERAKEIFERIREEDGCKVGAESFHAQINIDNLRCSMAPTRTAVWQVNTKNVCDNIRLSAFAATVLSDEGIININQLKLYRPCEYAVEENFMVSNLSGANPVLGTLGSLASGVVHWPVNVAKAWGSVVIEPYKGQHIFLIRKELANNFQAPRPMDGVVLAKDLVKVSAMWFFLKEDW